MWRADQGRIHVAVARIFANHYPRDTWYVSSSQQREFVKVVIEKRDLRNDNASSTWERMAA